MFWQCKGLASITWYHHASCNNWNPSGDQVMSASGVQGQGVWGPGSGDLGSRVRGSGDLGSRVRGSGVQGQGVWGQHWPVGGFSGESGVKGGCQGQGVVRGWGLSTYMTSSRSAKPVVQGLEEFTVMVGLGGCPLQNKDDNNNGSIGLTRPKVPNALKEQTLSHSLTKRLILYS